MTQKASLYLIDPMLLKGKVDFVVDGFGLSKVDFGLGSVLKNKRFQHFADLSAGLLIGFLAV